VASDHSIRLKLLRNAMLAFTVRHALAERNVSEVSFDIRDFGHNRLLSTVPTPQMSVVSKLYYIL